MLAEFKPEEDALGYFLLKRRVEIDFNEIVKFEYERGRYWGVYFDIYFDILYSFSEESEISVYVEREFKFRLPFEFRAHHMETDFSIFLPLDTNPIHFLWLPHKK